MDFPGSANNASNAFNTTATKLGKDQTASLDESIGEDGSQTRGDTLQSNDLSPEDAAIMKNAKARLAVWLQSLSETDRKIIALTKAGKKLREVSAAVGKSHEFVRQRIAKLQAEALKAMEVSGEFQGMQYQDKQRFGEGRHKLPVEQGPELLELPQERPAKLPDLNTENPGFLRRIAGVFDALPNEVTTHWGKTVFLKKREGKNSRLFHFITEGEDKRQKPYASTELKIKKDREDLDYEKIRWLPRVAETVKNAQVLLRDNVADAAGKRNYAYVRRYPEGWHVVITSQDGVFIGSRDYPTYAITQFGETPDGSLDHRDRFVILEKRAPWFQGEKKSLPPSAERGRASMGSTATETSPGTSGVIITDPNVEIKDSEVSKGSGPYSSAPENNIYPSLELVKSLYEKNDEISHRGVTWQDPVSLKTIITLFEKADSSTLIHEIAHYCFDSMEEAIRLGVADQRMIDDFNALKKWAESNPESMVNSAVRKLREESKGAPRNYKKFFDRLKKDEKKTRAELLALVQAMNEGTLPDRELTRSEQFILQYVATEKLCYD